MFCGSGSKVGSGSDKFGGEAKSDETATFGIVVVDGMAEAVASCATGAGFGTGVVHPLSVSAPMWQAAAGTTTFCGTASGARFVPCAFPTLSSSILSSGLSLTMSLLHSAFLASSLGEPGPPDPEVYLTTRSVHFWKMVSEMCKRQCTASKKAISLILISVVCNPEILLQALAE